MIDFLDIVQVVVRTTCFMHVLSVQIVLIVDSL